MKRIKKQIITIQEFNQLKIDKVIKSLTGRKEEKLPKKK